MQPTLAVCAAQAGILYLNGQFSGEISADEPLIRPIAPRGSVYLDFRPLTNACLPIARKLVFSGGKPMSESAQSCEDIGIILWPCGVTEIELAPPPFPQAQARNFSFDGHMFSVCGVKPKLYSGDRLLGDLPEGASLPRAIKTPNAYAFVGDANGAMYLLTVDTDLKNATGFLYADKIEFDVSGDVRATLFERDFSGHARIESWQLTADGPTLLSTEAAWADGSARLPKNAEETALAVVQAALLGKKAEVRAYMTEELFASEKLDALYAQYELCTEMKYAPTDNRPCLALLHLPNERIAIATPLYYACIRENGSYLLDQIEVSE